MYKVKELELVFDYENMEAEPDFNSDVYSFERLGDVTNFLASNGPYYLHSTSKDTEEPWLSRINTEGVQRSFHFIEGFTPYQVKLVLDIIREEKSLI
jgi:hypothetical protein